MEIKVGEYVRTDKGIIAKIDKEMKNLQMLKFLDVEYGNIIKHSNNIKDLIEDKDFVKIEFYSERYEKRVTRIFEVSRIEEKYITFENMHCDLFMIDGKWSNRDKLLNPIIKSILTHEQFRSLEYII